MCRGVEALCGHGTKINQWSPWRRERFHDSQDELEIKDFPQLHSALVYSVFNDCNNFLHLEIIGNSLNHIRLVQSHLDTEETGFQTAVLKGG